MRLSYCFTPYRRLWLYNDAPLVAFYDTLGIRKTYCRLELSRVDCGLASHSAICQLYSDGTDVQFPNFDLLPGTSVMGS